MKLDALGNFVSLYFSLNFNFLLPLFPGASRARKLCFWVISENITICGYLDRERKHKFLKIYYNLSLVCLYIILFMT